MRHKVNFLFYLETEVTCWYNKNTCWVTTVLYAAKLEHNCFSPVAWDLHCTRRDGVHGENPEDKTKETEFIQ